MTPRIKTNERPVAAQEGGFSADLAVRIEALKKEKWSYANFLEGLRDGVWHPTSRAEIREMVDEHFFRGKALTELSAEEGALLRKLAVEHLDSRINYWILADLVGDIYYAEDVKRESYDDRHNLFVPETKAETELPVRKLSLQEKLRLFSDPDFWLMASLHAFDRGARIETGLVSYGNRGLRAPDHLTVYAHSNGLLRHLIEENGKAVVLDIGSGVGLALRDLKRIYGDGIEAHGLTAEQEFAMYPMDYQHYGLAERMPEEFRGKFDLVFSNMAFRYFLFQHIALRNVVKALKAGGVAELHFSYERGPEVELYGDYFQKLVGETSHYDAMQVLVKAEMKKLRRLADAGFIDLDGTSKDFAERGNQGVIRIRKVKEFAYEKKA